MNTSFDIPTQRRLIFGTQWALSVLLFRLVPRWDEAVSLVTACPDLSRHWENINLGGVTETPSKHHQEKKNVSYF